MTITFICNLVAWEGTTLTWMSHSRALSSKHSVSDSPPLISSLLANEQLQTILCLNVAELKNIKQDIESFS